MAGTKSQIAVIMVPLPAQGHLNQLLHLSNRLSAATLPVYYLAAATHIRQAKLRFHGDNSSLIHFHELPTPPFENPSPNPLAPTKFPTQIVPSLSAAMHLRNPVYAFVNNLSNEFRRVVVIHDSLMAHVVQDLDAIRNCECYCFRSVSAFTIFSFSCEFSASGMSYSDLPDEVVNILKENPNLDDIFSPEFSEFADLQRGSKKIFSGDLYNSSRIIEGSYLDLLSEKKSTGTDKLWAVGPFNPISNLERKIHKCLKWLDEQTQNSVIFVSFGTTSSLCDDQIQELGLGLERSGHKFIWVLRDADKGDIFTGEVRKAELSKGFEERVEGRGIVVRDWAPQLEILSHFATGGFMTHCGWNSCMESISMGVPMATWPMHSDQPTNAVLVTKVLRIGVEVREWARRDEVASADRVEDAVRRLMGTEEGDEMRKRAEAFGVSVKDSVIKGSEMESFISHITR